MRLTPQRLVINSLSARRGAATIEAKGSVAWPNDLPQIALAADARNLTLDPALYDQLPDVGKRGWDAVRPQGTIDAHLTYSGGVASTPAPTTMPSVAPTASQPATRPFAMELVLVPRALSVTPTAVPYRLDNLQGEVTVLPDKVTFKDLQAKHGDATIHISATGLLAESGKWNFALKGDQVPVDAELRKALPETLGALLESAKVKGKVGFDFSRLIVATSTDASGQPIKSTKPSATTNSVGDVDVDFACTLTTSGASIDVGVPLENVSGTFTLEGSAKRGKLERLGGHIDVPSLTLAQRPVTNFRADLMKNPGNDAMQLDNMQARIADGDLAGRVGWISPDVGPARYALEMALRNADVPTLVGETGQDIKGQLSASVALEGNWSDPNSRRGRGDVNVSGQQMYKIPVILGLLQITNLSLPITSPFNEGNCRYSVDGQRVTFESIELRAKEMMMQGNGHLDFGTKQVKMTFVTDSTTWPKLPIVGDLLEGARHELLQIHVKGTLEEPKVSASMMNTFTTTVDEVFRGSENDKNGKGKK
jgi:hypothetical protein